MMRGALAVGVVVAALAYIVQRQAKAVQDLGGMPDIGAQDQGADFFSGIVDTVNSTISNMTASVPDALQDRNVQAFLQLIRTGEGTLGDRGYSTLFGGAQFSSFEKHPGVKVPYGSTYSTAAGAYQILASTWAEMRAQYDLPDFSPYSQDVAAVGLIKRRGALGDVLAGRMATAIQKCNREWASLPGSPYGQPTITMERAALVLAQNGVYSVESMTA